MTGSDNVGSISDIPLPPASPSPEIESQNDHSAWTPADYMRLLNVTTAKGLAIILVIAFGIYHSLLHATYGVTPCKGLLEDGMYKVNDIGVLKRYQTLFSLCRDHSGSLGVV